MRSKWLILATLLAALAACETTPPGATMSDAELFNETEVSVDPDRTDDGTWVILGQGVRGMELSQLTDYTLLHAAQAVQANGFAGFLVADVMTTDPTSRVVSQNQYQVVVATALVPTAGFRIAPLAAGALPPSAGSDVLTGVGSVLSAETVINDVTSRYDLAGVLEGEVE